MYNSLPETPQNLYKKPSSPDVIPSVILSRSDAVSPQNAPLGLRTHTASPSRQKTSDFKFERQNAAARLLPDWRVAKCLRDLAYGQTSVQVMYSPSVDAAHFKGLMVCGSVWTCPVCASKITELRRQELTKVMDAARAKGFGVALATFTQRHKKYEKCAELLEAFKQAQKRFKGGKGWIALKAKYGLLRAVSAIEVTHTETNGWHIHAHEEMVFDHDLSAEEKNAAEADFKRRWVGVANADWEHGFDLQTGHAAVESYITKFGREPKNDGWTLEHEITKSGVKTAAPGGRTPFGLLDDYIAGDLDAGDLFKEYAAAFFRRKQLQGLAEMKKLLGIIEVELSDQELAELEQAEAVTVLTLDHVEWGIVLCCVRRWELLDQVRMLKGDPGPVWDWLIKRCRDAKTDEQTPAADS